MMRAILCQAKRPYSEWSKNMYDNIEYYLIDENGKKIAGPFETEMEARRFVSNTD